MQCVEGHNFILSQLLRTPIQNRLLDLWSLVRFLRVKPLDDRSFWQILFEKPISCRTKQGFQRLQCFMQHLAMRRMKNQEVNGKLILVDLPPKTVRVEMCEFSKEERQLYDAMLREGKLTVNKYIQEGSLLHHYAEVLLILLRLRQICCHPYLVRKAAENAKKLGQAATLTKGGMIDDRQSHLLVELLMDVLQSGSDEQCPICLDSLQSPVITSCTHIYCKLCILQVMHKRQDRKSLALCPLCRREIDENKLLTVPEEKLEKVDKKVITSSEEWHSSVKIDVLMNHLIALRKSDPTAKSLVVSQFTSYLDLIETPLRHGNFSFVRLDGRMNQADRVHILQTFVSSKKLSPTILLLSMKAGGLGLNLMKANHVFLMDPAWNPAAEEQCFDRCYRLGQNKQVFITKFIIKNSVEERMVELQERKRALMSRSFCNDEVEGRQHKINDIRLLFN